MAFNVFRQVYGTSNMIPVELLQTSLPREPTENIGLYYHDIILQANGFIYTVIETYNHHRVLVLRPDDVWLAILIQFNFYVNGNAERLQNQLVVNHEGKKKLQVISIGDRYSVDFAEMRRTMTHLMKTRIVDPDLQNWVSPTFSMTTIANKTIYAIIMMASLEYFEYEFALESRWRVQSRTGKRYSAYSPGWRNYNNTARKPAHGISRFVPVYDDPDNTVNREFWKKVAHVEDEESGACYLGGWITAFCFFRADGTQVRASGEGPVLDGVVYPTVDTKDIPSGWAEVDVKLNESGEEVQTTMIVAGSIGSKICVSADSVGDTIRPLSAWWCLVTNKAGNLEGVEEME